MTITPWHQVLRRDRLRWLGLVAHEHFHTWNIKRLRPRGLGPFDYEREVYTPSLWIAEGLTSYYDDLLLVRAGLMKESEYLDKLGANIAAVQGRPGRLVQPLAQASFDAWIKHYRQDENSVNSSVSYYTKGAVVGWLLDAEIRRATGGRASLDHVMRAAFERFRAEGFAPDEFRALASEVAGTDLGPFFARTVDTAVELDFGGALQWWGLRFAPTAGRRGDDPVPGYLGATIDGGNLVQSVHRGTPAWDAGLAVGDEVIALDGARIDPGAIDWHLERRGAGHEGTLLVARRGRMVQVPLTLGEEPGRSWEVQIDPGASPQADRRRRAWLGL